MHTHRQLIPPRVILIIAALLWSACGDSDPSFVGEVPTNPDALRPWLIEENYLDWYREPAIHPSDGPHAQSVRTYFNTPLYGSLLYDNEVHRTESAAVKEMYADGVLVGWSVMVKREERAGADTWYWYELPDREPDTKPVEGWAHPTCTGCHEAGVDFVLTTLP